MISGLSGTTWQMKKKLTSPILIIEGGTQDADLRYISGFTAPDPVVLLVEKQRRSLVVSLLEYGRAKTTAKKVNDVFTPQQLGLQGAERGRLSGWALGLLKTRRIRSVAVGPTFPIGVAEQLRKSGIHVTVLESALFAQRRRRKSAEEIRNITITQRAAVHAMKVAVKMIEQATVNSRGVLVADGRRLRSETVRLEIERALLERGCAAGDTIVACGTQGAEPHARGHGPLRGGQPIVIDIFPRHKETGYWGDLTRTVIKGEPKPEVRRMIHAVRAAQHTALSVIRAGVTVKRVHETAQRVLREHGFETTVKNGWGEGFIHSTGHGIGLNVHEAPSLNLTNTRLLAGDVITVEPGLYYKKWGGVRWEDTVLVTREGCRVLVHCPVKPFLP